MKVTIDTDKLQECVGGMDGIMHPDDMPTVMAAILRACDEAEDAAVKALIEGYDAESPGPDHEYD